MTKTILGIFDNKLDAEAAIDDLADVGYNAQDISIMMRETPEISRDSASEATAKKRGNAVTGGILGGIAGVLLGIGAIAVPGVGTILISGPLAASLGTTGLATPPIPGAAIGVLAGGIIGALIGIGLSQKDATSYEEGIKEGGILMAVPATDQQEEVTALFEDNGARYIRVIEADLPEYNTEEERFFYNEGKPPNDPVEKGSFQNITKK